MDGLAHARDPLVGGFYTVKQAARLLGVDRAQRIYGWISGYSSSAAGPVIKRDYDPLGGSQIVSFWDLMEIRFLEHFRRQGVPLQTLRKAAASARATLGSDHPFALSNVRFLTDRKKIFLQTAKEENDRKTLDIVSNQYEMYETIENILAKGVAFDPISALAVVWHPMRDDCPDVVVDPRVAFGRPSIEGAGVPTSALFRSWKAEGGDHDRVARWFNVDRAAVEQAVTFEVRLAAA